MIGIVARRSLGATALAQYIEQQNVPVRIVRTPVPGYFNVGWGVPHPDNNLNRRLPPHKLWELERCAEAGVPTIPFFTDLASAALYALHKYRRDHAQDGINDWRLPPMILGRRLHHTQGRDIVGVMIHPHHPHVSMRNLTVRVRRLPRRRRPEFWTVFIPKSAEYRVHVFQNKAIRSASKLPHDNPERAPRHHGNAEEIPIWNLRNGFKFYYNYPAPREAKDLAKRAVQACGLDFGAVDVVRERDEFYVLEINTRPGLQGNTTRAYGDHVIRAAREFFGAPDAPDAAGVPGVPAGPPENPR